MKSLLLAACLASLVPGLAVAGDTCSKVKIEDDGFGGRVWKLGLNWGTFSLFQLKRDGQGTTFSTVAAEYNISTKAALPGALAQISFGDGTVLSHTLPSGAAPTLISNGSGTVWQVAMPVNASQLAQLAASPIKNVRIDVGDGAYIGGAPVFSAGWAKKLQAAAACWSTLTAQ